MADKLRCKWEISWVGQCPKEAGPNGFCKEHTDKKCVCCGEMATHDCEHTGIQFVCGAPLCNNCAHGIPDPKNPGIFGMGGGHHPLSVVNEQVQKMFSQIQKEAS